MNFYLIVRLYPFLEILNESSDVCIATLWTKDRVISILFAKIIVDAKNLLH